MTGGKGDGQRLEKQAADGCQCGLAGLGASTRQNGDARLCQELLFPCKVNDDG
jgi:hypothetical protein